MPRISEFYGIVIVMNYRDHPPPHFHAWYGEHEASFDIATGMLADGSLPTRARRLVEEWAVLHRSELLTDWELAERHRPLHRIPGLD